jgi:hypothetical protein
LAPGLAKAIGFQIGGGQVDAAVAVADRAVGKDAGRLDVFITAGVIDDFAGGPASAALAPSGGALVHGENGGGVATTGEGDVGAGVVKGETSVGAGSGFVLGSQVAVAIGAWSVVSSQLSVVCAGEW